MTSTSLPKQSQRSLLVTEDGLDHDTCKRTLKRAASAPEGVQRSRLAKAGSRTTSQTKWMGMGPGGPKTAKQLDYSWHSPEAMAACRGQFCTHLLGTGISPGPKSASTLIGDTWYTLKDPTVPSRLNTFKAEKSNNLPYPFFTKIAERNKLAQGG
eukprot:TRINITY_DN33327_c0_g1_i1.p1 TRINITY_DN33327_c0_g1~~TRINITY_DN33327_c0_g1_i1.p1  ORF type:complete len:168 (+),score=25.70 TRINITY_DN33327_c0_g1_i1:40-504(+)